MGDQVLWEAGSRPCLGPAAILEYACPFFGAALGPPGAALGFSPPGPPGPPSGFLPPVNSEVGHILCAAGIVEHALVDDFPEAVLPDIVLAVPLQHPDSHLFAAGGDAPVEHTCGIIQGPGSF